MFWSVNFGFPSFLNKGKDPNTFLFKYRFILLSVLSDSWEIIFPEITGDWFLELLIKMHYALFRFSPLNRLSLKRKKVAIVLNKNSYGKYLYPNHRISWTRQITAG